MRILLQYESHTPHLEGLGRLVAELLRRQGNSVDMVDLGEKQVRVLGHYQAIVLVTNIWWGKLSGQAINFIKRDKEELLDKPFAMIVSSYHNDENFQKIVSRALSPEILEHAHTYKLGMNVEYELLNPIDKLRWSVTGQKVEHKYSQREAQETVKNLFN